MTRSVQKKTGSDRRRAARTALTLPAVVKSIDGRVQLPCSVKDMSATGAGVVLPQSYRPKVAADIPDEVLLVLPLDRLGIYGMITWRDGFKFGVRFASAFVPVSAQGRPTNGLRAAR